MGCLLPLTSSKMYASYGYGGLKINGTWFDGSSWSANETVSVNSIAWSGGYSAVADANDNIHVAYLNDTTFEFIHRERLNSTSTWQSENVIQGNYIGDYYYASPALSLNGDNLCCFWSGYPTNNHIFYKDYTSGSWNASATDWITETDIPANYTVNSFYKVSGGYIGILYLTNGGWPYNVSSALAPDNNAPVTNDNYDGKWHLSDFTITLGALDSIGSVNRTYYRINGDSTRTTSGDGQPLINFESANNTLEYWSIDNAGNEELPHKFLVNIKLDKVPPTIHSISQAPQTVVDAWQSVLIYVNATEEVSGMDNVTLMYMLNQSGYWIKGTADFNATTGIYEYTIQGQPAGSFVQYKIIAYNKAGNGLVDSNGSQYYVYSVIPEYPVWSLLFLLLIPVVLHRRRAKKTNQF